MFKPDVTELLIVKKKRNRNKNDKVFDNSYNQGTIDFQVYEPAQILSQFEMQQLSPYYEAFDYYRIESLIDIIHAIWNNTERINVFGEIKKIKKQHLSEIYTYFLTHFPDSTYTNCEIFITIADFFGISYKTLYEMILPVYKINILKEIDDKYNILNKNLTVSLF